MTLAKTPSRARVTGFFGSNSTQASWHGALDVSNVPSFCASPMISVLSSPISGRNTQFFGEPSIEADGQVRTLLLGAAERNERYRAALAARSDFSKREH